MKRTHIHNPWRSHKPVKESLLKATRECKFIHLSNEEILARDLEWENQYPSMKERATKDHEKIDTLGVNIINVDTKPALLNKVEHPTTKSDNDYSSTKNLPAESGDLVSKLQAELERILGKENRVGQGGTF